jgi:hypothetical protein
MIAPIEAERKSALEGSEGPGSGMPEALDFSAGPGNDFSRHGDKVVPQALACPQNTD